MKKEENKQKNIYNGINNTKAESLIKVKFSAFPIKT